MEPPCSFCRAIPKRMRDLLLRVFAEDDCSNLLHRPATDYVRWGMQGMVRGESTPFPVMRNRAGDLDPTDVLRAAVAYQSKRVERDFLISDDCECISVGIGRIVVKSPHRRVGYDPDAQGDLSPLPIAPPTNATLVKHLAGLFSVDERTVVSALHRAMNLFIEHHSDTYFAFAFIELISQTARSQELA